MPLGEPKSQKRSRAALNITNVSKIEDMPLCEQKIQNQFDMRMRTKRTRTSQSKFEEICQGTTMKILK